MYRLLAVLLWAALGTGVINAQAGHWRLVGGGTFIGDEQWQEGDGWVGRVENRSQSQILVSQSFRGGEVSKTLRLEWRGVPQLLQPGELPALPGRATLLTMHNPSGLSINSNVSCFIKTPHRSFWEGDLPKPGTLELRNTSLRIPQGLPGSQMIITYQVLGFGTAKKTEFTYKWTDGAASSGGRAEDGLPAIGGGWRINNRPASIKQSADGVLLFINEGGARSAGRFIDANTVIATDWVGGLRGTLEDGGNTIRWANGTVWFRSRPQGR